MCFWMVYGPGWQTGSWPLSATNVTILDILKVVIAGTRHIYGYIIPVCLGKYVDLPWCLFRRVNLVWNP